MKIRVELMSLSEKSDLVNIMFLLFSLLFFSNDMHGFAIETPVAHIFPYCEIDGIRYKYDPETLTASVIDDWYVWYKRSEDGEDAYYYVPLTKGYNTTSVTIPSTIVPPEETREYTVTKINQAFHLNLESTHVKEIIIPETIEEIIHSFSDCKYLEKFNLKNVRFIDWASFRVCKNLESFQINEDNPAYSVRDGLLYNKGCDTLLLVPAGRYKISYILEIPEGTTTIREDAMQYGNVEKILCPSTLVSIETFAFAHNSSLRSVSFNQGLKRIARQAFVDCNITDISLPDSLEEINYCSFYRCPLKRVIIPASVKVADDSFNRDVSLVFIGTTPPDAERRLDNNNNPKEYTGTLYVPEEALQAYQEHVFWGQYQSIIGYTDLDELLASLPSSVSSPRHHTSPVPIFDLHGRKLHQIPNKGLYIRNNKKWLK